MAQPVVVFDGVWKKFRRGERHDSLRDLLPSLARRAFGRAAPRELDGEQEFWAVKDVSFEAGAGEAVGIIGPNGAGKSTTLKLLTRILRPTRGVCRVTGRVGALIEVAAGFHPDLTGRENVYLQGAVMGMTRADITAKFDAIVEFSGLEKFVDTPVKRYSSGMNARLGFAIAAHLDPDVLIIDEVLAVGDMMFQRRCTERILSLKQQGTTLVFVSHNLAAVEMICDRTLVLRDGGAQFWGAPKQATAVYYGISHERSKTAEGPQSSRHGTQEVQIVSVRVNGQESAEAMAIKSGDPVELELRIRCVTGPRQVLLGFSVLDAAQTQVFGENGSAKAKPFVLETGAEVTCRILIESLAVPEGTYSFTVAAHSPLTAEIYDWQDSVRSLSVDLPDDPSRNGSIGLLTRWTIERAAADRVPQGTAQ